MYQDPDHNHRAWAIAVVVLAIVGLVIGLVIGIQVAKNNNPKPKIISKEYTGVAINNIVVSATSDIADNISQMKDYSTFMALLEAADMKDSLHGVGPYTVLLPSDKQFQALDQKHLSILKDAKDTDKAAKTALVKLLTTNIINGTYTTADLRIMAALKKPVTTISGQKFDLTMDENKKVSIVIPDTSKDPDALPTNSANSDDTKEEGTNKDENQNKERVLYKATFAPVDAIASNGIIHASSHVLIPDNLVSYLMPAKK